MALGLSPCLHQLGTVAGAGSSFLLPAPLPVSGEHLGDDRKQMQEEAACPLLLLPLCSLEPFTVSAHG